MVSRRHMIPPWVIPALLFSFKYPPLPWILCLQSCVFESWREACRENEGFEKIQHSVERGKNASCRIIRTAHRLSCLSTVVHFFDFFFVVGNTSNRSSFTRDALLIFRSIFFFCSVSRDLSDNEIVNVDRGAFGNLSRLVDLDLARNSLRGLTKGFFFNVSRQLQRL
jgi:hypothetical protein